MFSELLNVNVSLNLKPAQKPLTPECLKAVLQYFDASQRLTLATRSSVFKFFIHEREAISIDHLVLKETSFIINNTEHIFKTILEHPTGEELLFNVSQNNLNGGVPYDVDEYGSKERKSHLAPGDYQVGDVPDEQAEVDVLEQQKRENEERLKHGLLPIRIAGDQKDPVGEEEEPVPKVRRISFPDGIVRPTPILLRPNPVKLVLRPQYKTYVLYTTKCSQTGDSKTVQLPKSIKIRDAIRKLLGILFGTSGVPVVKDLDIFMEQGVLRFGKSTKLQVKALNLSSKALEGIHKIIKPTGPYPAKISFDSLSIKFNSGFDRMTFPMGEVLVRLSTRSIHLSEMQMRPNDLFNLIQNWIDSPRQMGTKFSAGCSKVIMLIEMIRRRTHMALGVMNNASDPDLIQCGTRQLSPTCELNIYGKKAANYDEEVQKANGNPYVLVMEVMEPGSARVVN